jgi:hypothetical protein
VPRYCERVRECGCLNHQVVHRASHLDRATAWPGDHQPMHPEACRPTSAHLGDTQVMKFCGTPEVISGAREHHAGRLLVQHLPSDQCDERWPAYPDDYATPGDADPAGLIPFGTDRQFFGKPCSPYTLRNGIFGYWCFDPAASDPRDSRPAEQTEACGDHWTRVVNLSNEWQFLHGAVQLDGAAGVGEAAGGAGSDVGFGGSVHLGRRLDRLLDRRRSVLQDQDAAVTAEDGYRLWLRYERSPTPPDSPGARAVRVGVHARDDADAGGGAQRAGARLAGMLGAAFFADTVAEATLVVGTPLGALRLRNEDIHDESPFFRLFWMTTDAFVIDSVAVDARRALAISSFTDAGVLYGVFHFLRHLQTGRPLDAIDAASGPRIGLRMLDHWDNLDGSIERGYAGRSLWRWDELPDTVSPRMRDYARANASIGINAVALNNVNASAQILTPATLRKVAALADVFRPWGIRVFLSTRWSAPIELAASPPPIRVTRASPPGGGRRSTRSTRWSPTSAASWSRRTPRASRARRTTAARTPTAPTCWRTRSRRTRASSSGERSSTRPASPRTAPSRRTPSSCRWTDRSGRT